MKLKKLYIAEYKNLKDFNLDFESGKGLTILIGNNGSGKSNVLEAISAIFANAYAGKRIHKFAYSLSYEINGKEVELTQTIYKCQYYVEGEVISVKNLAQGGYLPTNVIALYSGEDKRWWHGYYEPFYTQYIRKIEAGVPHTTGPKMYYINKYYWDIALLTLIYSMADDDKAFLKNKIGIETVDHILLFYNRLGTKKCKSELLKSFLDTTNTLSTFCTEESGEPVFLYGMQDKEIFSTYGIHVYKGNAETKDWFLFTNAKFLANRPEEGFNYLEKEVFDFFAQAYMPKNKKVIKDIEIICNGYSAKHLSEGEKKLILIRAILSFVADENSLILFDEPDANIHESRKQDLYHLYSEFSEFNRQMVVATHSPIIAQLSKSTELVMLETENNKTVILSNEKIDKIKRLSGTTWDVIGQAMMLNSNKPLVVFEGKTDVMYVKRAFELLGPCHERYQKIDVDFINASGAGNMKSFVENLQEFIPKSRKIIVFFDHDNAGKDGAKALTGVSKDDERIAHFQDIIFGNLTVSFIPYKAGVEDGDFLIEDYFSWDKTIKLIFDDLIPNKKHPVKQLPNLAIRIKSEIEKRYISFSADEFEGFTSLLDKISLLIEDDEKFHDSY